MVLLIQIFIGFIAAVTVFSLAHAYLLNLLLYRNLFNHFPDKPSLCFLFLFFFFFSVPFLLLPFGHCKNALTKLCNLYLDRLVFLFLKLNARAGIAGLGFQFSERVQNGFQKGPVTHMSTPALPPKGRLLKR